MPLPEPSARTPSPASVAQQHLAMGEVALAVASLLPVLDARAAAGDAECQAAAAILRHWPATPDEPGGIPPPPDPLSGALDRLARLVERQEEQIRALTAPTGPAL